MNTWRERAKDIHDTAVSKGWWDQDRDRDEVYALIHSEVSEALEAFRKLDDWKSAAVEELADVVIRVLDWCQARPTRMYGLEDGVIAEPIPDVEGVLFSTSLNYVHQAISWASRVQLNGISDLREEGRHLAVVVLLCEALAAELGGNLHEALDAKQKKNRLRPHRHGGLRC